MLVVGDCLTMSEPARAEGLVTDGERIVAIGRVADLAARWPGQRRVRVERITPGVHDAHVHPALWGQALECLDLTGVTDPRTAADFVAAHVRELEPGAWVRGGGYLFDHYPEHALLTLAAPANPVFLASRDLHSAWVNRAALEAAGIGADSADPEGGRILRDACGGPSGYLLERAVGLVARVLPPLEPADLERGLTDLARRGYVAAHAMPYSGAVDLPWAEHLARSSSLPLRLWWAVPAESVGSVSPGWRGEDLEVAAVKLFADGALGSRTAWMHAPYADSGTGMPVEPPERLQALARAAQSAGFGLAIHAIGTRAVEVVLGILAGLATGAPRRPRIEHAQHIRDEELEVLLRVPAAVSMQPIHLHADAALVRRYLSGREDEAFRFRSVIESGATLAFGSDAPVVAPDLSAGIDAATHHALDHEQSLGFEDAVRAFTRGAALAAGWDQDGRLVADGRADLGLWEGTKLVGRVYRGVLEWLSNA